MPSASGGLARAAAGRCGRERSCPWSHHARRPQEAPQRREIGHRTIDGRAIEPGEQYDRQRNIGDDGPYVFKACAHCEELRKVSTVTENADYFGEGYTADDYWEWEPSTVWEARLRAQFRRKWRRRDGSLFPLPVAPEREASA